MRKRRVLRLLMCMSAALGLVVTSGAFNRGALGAEMKAWSPKSASEWTSPKPKKKYTIAALIPSLEAEYWVNYSYGVYDQARKQGVNLKFAATRSYSDFAKQLDYIEDMINLKVDAIILSPAHSVALVEPALKAEAAGIKVIATGGTLNTDKITGAIRADHFETGYRIAKFLFNSMGGEGGFVVLNGPPGQTWGISRRNGMMKAMKEFPKVKMLGERWMGVSRVEGLQHTEDFLQTFPDVKGIWNAVDITAAGSVDAIKAAGIKRHIFVASGSGTRHALEMVKKGDMDYDIGESPVLQGRWAIDMAIKALQGESHPALIFIPMADFTSKNVAKWDTSTEWHPKGWKLPR